MDLTPAPTPSAPALTATQTSPLVRQPICWETMPLPLRAPSPSRSCANIDLGPAACVPWKVRRTSLYAE